MPHTILPAALVLFFAFPSAAQIVNVLSELSQSEKNGLSGEIDAGFDWKTGNTEHLTLTGGLGTRFRYDSHSLYLIWAGKYASAGDLSFEHRVMTHLRYRLALNDWLAAELFGQHEYNEFRRLQRRELAGVGPRFGLLSTDRIEVSLGVAYMFENEELNDDLDDQGVPLDDAGAVALHHRLSSYLSLSAKLAELLTVDGTVFFQPRFDAFTDFRLLAELSVELLVLEHLSVGLSGNVGYDSTPPVGVESLDTALIGKISVSFGTIPIG